MKLKKIFKIIFITCIIIIALDQIMKILVIKFVKDDIVLISNNVLIITKLENEGIAFGLNKQNLGNIGLSLIVLIVIFNYIIAQKDRMKEKVIIYLSLIIAGGISNLIDRIFRGAVFDFIKIENFPVFNIADVCVVCGWILFVIYFIKETAIDIKAETPVKKKKTK